MKKNKKLLMMICIVSILIIGSFSTLAYLTDTAGVVNTFTVGNVGIELDEAMVDEDGNPVKKDESTGNYVTTDENGNPVTLETADRTQNTTDPSKPEGNKYRAVPGKTYAKDPTMTVAAGSEESYVRMLVTVDKISAFDAIFDKKNVNLKNIFVGYNDSLWEYKGETRVGDTITYEFRYKETVDALKSETPIKLAPLFTSVTIPTFITGDQLQTINPFHITVVGNAIQAVGFENADEAWEAFDEQQNPPAQQ